MKKYLVELDETQRMHSAEGRSREPRTGMGGCADRRGARGRKGDRGTGPPAAARTTREAEQGRRTGSASGDGQSGATGVCGSDQPSNGLGHVQKKERKPW
jgi:hypothetical protein